MKLTEMRFAGATPVEGYGPGFFRLGGQVFQGPIVVTAQAVTVWGGLSDKKSLLALKGDTDVLLIGTGTEMVVLPAALRRELEDAGIGVESMTTPTACRTYNVLLAEGRRCALAAEPV